MILYESLGTPMESKIWPKGYVSLGAVFSIWKNETFKDWLLQTLI